jgi:phospholipase/carboxylesterase
MSLPSGRWARRQFCVGTAGAAVAMLGACANRPDASGVADDGRLLSRPGPPTGSITPGIHPLGLAAGPAGWILVPAGYDPSRAWPLALFFRGAITPSKTFMDAFVPLADETGMVFVAPEPRGRTWDIVNGAIGADARLVDAALAEAFRRVRVDPARVCASGFSDGASYALSIGLRNGDFLAKVAAYSPGFMIPSARRGSPQFFVTHGRQDPVLPIERAGRSVVAQLRDRGYAVEFREFDGAHGVSPTLARESIRWMAGG